MAMRQIREVIAAQFRSVTHIQRTFHFTLTSSYTLLQVLNLKTAQ